MQHNEHLSRRILEDANLMELFDPRKLPEGLPGQQDEKEKSNGKGQKVKRNNCLNGLWRSNKIMNGTTNKAKEEVSEEL
jgi:hypothetical protein